MFVLVLLFSVSAFSFECNFENYIDENGIQICSFEKEFSESAEIEEEYVSQQVGERHSMWMPELKIRQGFEEVVSGPVFRSANPFKRYDRWRYVTFYDVTKERNRLLEFPRIYEECQDEYSFTTLEESISLTLEVGASLKFADIGISGKVSESKRITVRRNLRGVQGEEAVHTLYILSQRWKGRTFIQTYDSRSKKVSLRYLPEGFFEIANVDPAWRVVRDDIKVCEGFRKQEELLPPGVPRS